MAVEITGRYDGNLKVELTHGPSGRHLTTAAPVDNNGDGSSFSPTDLLAASLGACMVTIMGIVAAREGISLDGLSFRLEKHMASDPRRVSSVPVTIEMPAGLSPEARRRLEAGALACPVHKSLPPELKREVRFLYPD